MKMRAFAIHVAMLLCLAANAQHLPGGVSAPFVWSSANEQISATDTLPQDTKGFSSFQVVIPTAEAENATITSGQTLVTSRRVAEPGSGQYINFASDAIFQGKICVYFLTLAVAEHSGIDYALADAVGIF